MVAQGDFIRVSDFILSEEVYSSEESKKLYLISRTFIEADRVSPEGICEEVHRDSYYWGYVHIDFRVLVHVGFAEQVLGREVIDKCEGHYVYHYYLDKLVEDAYRVTCEFTHVPVQQFLQAGGFQQVYVEGRKYQEYRSLYKNSSDYGYHVIYYVFRIPADAHFSCGQDEKSYSQATVSQSREPVRIYKDDLKQQSSRTQHKSVKTSVTDGLSEVSQSRKEDDHYSVSQEQDAEEEKHFIYVPSAQSIKLKQRKVDDDYSRCFSEKYRQ